MVFFYRLTMDGTADKKQRLLFFYGSPCRFGIFVFCFDFDLSSATPSLSLTAGLSLSMCQSKCAWADQKRMRCFHPCWHGGYCTRENIQVMLTDGTGS